MKPIFIGIAGGTGAGKSTLCTALQDKYPDTIGLMQLDDYFKPAAEAPRLEGIVNWDHPDALYLDRLARDISELTHGRSVIINTKNERLNPEFSMTGKRKPVEIHPKPIMLVEGYLVLHSAQVRPFLTTSIWLDVDHATRWSRRVHFKNPTYENKVLRPMHQRYVEPTKQYAGHVLDVSGLSRAQVLENVEGVIFPRSVKAAGAR